MKIGDRVFVRGYIDEIRKDTIIIRNAGGYFGTIPSEVITGELPSAQPEKHTEERTEAHSCDCIERQAAIDAIDAIFPVEPMKNEYTQGITCGAEEPKKCDTCRHVKEPWFNRCADCSDYELWEAKDEPS